MSKKYRQYPVEAIQWTGKNFKEMENFALGNLYRVPDTKVEIAVRTSYNNIDVMQLRDWLARDCHSSLHILKDSYFLDNYEVILAKND